jgi:sigma-E factor negative regulatory protein RseA
MVAQPAGQGADRASSPTLASPVATAANDAGERASRTDAAPAVAPPWVNAYADAPYRISQQASATLDGGDNSTLLYSRNSLTPYRVARYPVVNNGDGSYLLLIHPDQQPAQAPASAQ